jgi:hypothetical protein
MTSFAAPRASLAPVHWALLGWAVATFSVGLLPEGVGDGLRTVNALVFLTLGPGCALLLVLVDVMPLPTALVVSLGASLGVLLLSSQVLLVMGLWRHSTVTALVATVTVGLVLAPWPDLAEG